MRNEALPSRNVAAIAALPNEPESSSAHDDEREERGSDRIRRTSELLRELLLRDQYAPDVRLSCHVREALEEMSSDLQQLAGQQLLFELWIGG